MGMFDDLIAQYAPKGGSVGGAARKMSPQEQKALNELREYSDASNDVLDVSVRARDALRRFKPSQTKSNIYDMLTTDEKPSGFFDRVGGMIGDFVLDPQDRSDFQTLRALQSSLVLNEQVKQKGSQTESDSARISLTQVSPFKSQSSNEALLGPAITNAMSGANKASFYTRWANSYGLNGLNEAGRSVDEEWMGKVNSARSEQQRAVNAGRPRLNLPSEVAASKARRGPPAVGVPGNAPKKRSTDDLLRIYGGGK